jgi:Zn-dependent peptidase ImmA (M78 family)
MDEDYRVPSKSNDEIEAIAEQWRLALCGGENPPQDIFAVLEKAARDFKQTSGLEIIQRNNEEMGSKEAYAISDDNSRRLFVRSSIFERAKKADSYAVGTLIHELAHIVLHPGAAPKARLATTNRTPAYIAPHESAEHQARLFTAAFQMPREEVRKLSSPQEIKEKFGVSLEAAKLRHKEVIQKTRPRDLPQSARTYLDDRKLKVSPPKNTIVPYIPIRRKSKIDELWEAAPFAANHDPSEYRVSIRGFLIKRSEYLKLTHFAWFIVEGKIYAHRETSAASVNDDELCSECGNLTMRRSGTHFSCSFCGLNATS